MVLLYNFFLNHIDIDNHEEETEETTFSDLDEFINSLFVHSWSSVNLKCEQQSKKPNELKQSIETTNPILVTNFGN